MNINPDKVKKLVLAFAELDEEYQDELLKKAYELELLQAEKNNIKKEGATFKNKEELQKEVVKRTNEATKEALDLIEILKTASDTEKASVFMLMNQLAHKSNTVKEADVSIIINQKEIPMKEYLEKYMFSADYNKAKAMTDTYLAELRERNSTKK